MALLLACCDAPDVVQDSARFATCRNCKTLMLMEFAPAIMHRPHEVAAGETRLCKCGVTVCVEQVGQDDAGAPVFCLKGATADDGHCNAHRAAEMALEARLAEDQAMETAAAAERVEAYLEARATHLGIDQSVVHGVGTNDGIERLVTADLALLVAYAKRATEID